MNLLDPSAPPFLLCDRGLAAQACRFSTLIGWYFPLPHCWRLEAMGVERIERLRALFETVFGERMRFTGERRDNLLGHLKSKETPHDPALRKENRSLLLVILRAVIALLDSRCRGDDGGQAR